MHPLNRTSLLTDQTWIQQACTTCKNRKVSYSTSGRIHLPAQPRPSATVHRRSRPPPRLTTPSSPPQVRCDGVRPVCGACSRSAAVHGEDSGGLSCQFQDFDRPPPKRQRPSRPKAADTVAALQARIGKHLKASEQYSGTANYPQRDSQLSSSANSPPLRPPAIRPPPPLHPHKPRTPPPSQPRSPHSSTQP